MTIQEAIKSGKPFKRKYWIFYVFPYGTIYRVRYQIKNDVWQESERGYSFYFRYWTDRVNRTCVVRSAC